MKTDNFIGVVFNGLILSGALLLSGGSHATALQKTSELRPNDKTETDSLQGIFRRADGLVRRAEAAFQNNHLSESAELFRESLDLLDSRLAESDRVPASLVEQVRVLRMKSLYEIAHVLRRQGEHAEALRYALEDHEKLLGSTDPILQLPRQKSALGIATDLVALSYFQRAQKMLDQIKNESDLYGELRDVQLITFLSLQAIVADQAGNDGLYSHRWKQVGAEAARMLGRIQKKGRQLDMWAAAHALLVVATDALSEPGYYKVSEQVLQKFELSNDIRSRRNLFVRVAMLHILRRDFQNAERYLKKALPLTAGEDSDNRLARAQLLTNTATCLALQQRHEEATEQWNAATEVYESMLPELTASRQEAVSGVLVQLAAMYRKLGLHTQAVDAARRLYRFRLQMGSANEPLIMDAKAALATTLAASGQHLQARPLLFSVVSYWRNQQPHGKRRLSQMLSNLGAVEKTLGNSRQARVLFEEALQLEQQQLRGHQNAAVLAIAYGNYATSLLDEGRYVDAVQQFEHVLNLCEGMGDRAISLKAATLLNLANAYRSQGQFDRSLARGLEALDEFVALSGRANAGVIPFLQSLAAIYRETGQYQQAYELAQEALEIVSGTTGQQRPLTVAAVQTTLASVCDLAGESTSAEHHWKIAQAIYEAHYQPLAVARILNRRAVIALQSSRYKEAETHLTRARELLKETGSSTIELHNVLANQAEVQRREGHHRRAGETLAAALELLEKPRIETSGAGNERAQFLVRFGNAYDKAIEWAINDGDFDTAFELSERRRSRTLLDDFRTAGLDLQQASLSVDSELDDDTLQLLVQEQQIRGQLSELRYQSHLAKSVKDSISNTASSPTPLENASDSVGQVSHLGEEYQRVVSELRSRNPACRELLRQAAAPVRLDEFRSLLSEGQIALIWHIGYESSHVIAVGYDHGDTRAFRLSLNATLPEWVDTLIDSRNEFGKETLRGLKRVRRPTTTESGGKLSNVDSGHSEFTAEKCVRFVEWYRMLIDRKTTPLIPVDQKGTSPESSKHLESVERDSGNWQAGVDQLTFERLTAFSNAVLPNDLLDWLHRRQPTSLIAIPDGALHRLPLESLVLRRLAVAKPANAGGASSSADESVPPTLVRNNYAYALQVLPSITYLASASFLAELSMRDASSGSAEILPRASQCVLVGNPAYPDHSASLPRLAGTDRECRTIAETIRSRFPNPVLLLAVNATESRVISAIQKAAVIHIAAHGLVDEQSGNLFGSIALTPAIQKRQVSKKIQSHASFSASVADDGFLEYREIARLRLPQCRLAVLSACRTLDGPRRPMEAGASLANAFLTSGARSVIASHWSVDDASTAELMTGFYEKLVMGSSADPDGFNPARSLRDSKLKLLQTSSWQAPWYWSPFALSGQAD